MNNSVLHFILIFTIFNFTFISSEQKSLEASSGISSNDSTFVSSESTYFLSFKMLDIFSLSHFSFFSEDFIKEVTGLA